MEQVEVLLIAVGLAMDCLSVAITSGLTMGNSTLSSALRIGLSFGFFQAFMPMIGWIGGTSMISLVSGVDHWVALGLLCLIGFKMIFESLRKVPSEKKTNPLRGFALLMLSVATSIDALAVGFSLALLETPIIAPVVVIGSVTFLISSIGVYVGNRFGHFFGSKVETVGGFILIAIGVKILLEHSI